MWQDAALLLEVVCIGRNRHPRTRPSAENPRPRPGLSGTRTGPRFGRGSCSQGLPLAALGQAKSGAAGLGCDGARVWLQHKGGVRRWTLGPAATVGQPGF